MLQGSVKALAPSMVCRPADAQAERRHGHGRLATEMRCAKRQPILFVKNARSRCPAELGCASRSSFAKARPQAGLNDREAASRPAQ
jgi:hypothetical protein